MKTLTVRLPDRLVLQIEGESRVRRISKSDIVRERLSRTGPDSAGIRALIGDLIGAVVDLPSDRSANKKKHLAQAIGANKRHR